MAASTSAAAAAAASMTAKQLRRSFPLVDRFLIREARMQASIKEQGVKKNKVDADRGRVSPDPTRPYQDPVTNRWYQARLSLRRQADLGREAYAQGRFDELIQSFDAMGFKGTKLRKMQKRIESSKRLEQDRLLAQASAQGSADETKVHAATKHTTVSKEQAAQQARKLAEAIASHSGPYVGRSPRNIFKGSIAERKAPARRKLIEEQMGAMDRRIEFWRKSRKEAKLKSRPRLPF